MSHKDRASYLDALRNKVKESASGNLQKDSEGYFQLADKDAKHGSAIIRFLPATQGDDFPFVQIRNHAFQGAGWYIEACPTTLGEKCPVCDANRSLYNSGKDADKAIAKDRKYRLYYHSNVLVIKHPHVPANEGKVLLFKYGVKIFDKVKEMLNPPAELADTEPINPFDLELGCNFKLRMIKEGSFPNYDQSTFDHTPTAVGDEDRIALITSQCSPLAALIAPSQFKLYGVLKARYEQVVGVTPDSTSDLSATPGNKTT
jgi:hypothetical protein